jgi:hypothetical protein
MTPWLFLFLALVPEHDSVMLRSRGIGTITSSSTTDSGSGFEPAGIPLPSGSDRPTPATTPSPFSTYSADWQTGYSFNWAASSFDIPTNLIGNFSIENMGTNFAIIKTASPEYR